MRAIGLALGLAGWMVSMPPLILAQQRPAYGCNAAPSCRPLGFASLNSNAGVSGVFFGVVMRWGPGFDLHLVGPLGIPLFEKQAPPVDGELFHLRVSLLPPAPAVTPAPTPTRNTSASREPAKD